MLKKGVWLGVDTFGHPEAPPIVKEDTKIQTVKKLVDAGFGHKICLGHDWMIWAGVLPAAGRAAMKKANPDNYCHIYRKVLPRLQELGLTKEQTDALVNDNPRRYLENKP